MLYVYYKDIMVRGMRSMYPVFTLTLRLSREREISSYISRDFGIERSELMEI
jgi:hypothetical protein